MKEYEFLQFYNVITDYFQHNHYVKSLDLSHNNLQTEGVKCIAEVIAETSTITNLVSPECKQTMTSL